MGVGVPAPKMFLSQWYSPQKLSQGSQRTSRRYVRPAFLLQSWDPHSLSWTSSTIRPYRRDLLKQWPKWQVARWSSVESWQMVLPPSLHMWHSHPKALHLTGESLQLLLIYILSKLWKLPIVSSHLGPWGSRWVWWSNSTGDSSLVTLEPSRLPWTTYFQVRNPLPTSFFKRVYLF